MMRLLLVGSNAEGSLESYYLNALYSNKEIDVHVFPCRNLFFDFYNQSLLHKSLYKLGISGIYRQINKRLLALVRSVKPDIVLIFKGMEIFPGTLVGLQEMGIKLVNYNPDHPFKFYGKGTGNKNVRNSIGLYHLYLSYSQSIAEEIEDRYDIDTGAIPFGYNMLVDKPVAEREEIAKVCFIGYPDRDRFQVLHSLQKQKIPLDVYGKNWHRWLKEDENLTIHGSVFGNSYSTTASKYRVGLNLYRPHNANAHNMRSFELPAAGTIQLLPYSAEFEGCFDDNSEVVFYNSNKQIALKAMELLNLSFVEANKIKENALAKSVKGRYSYKNRTGQLLNYLNNL